MTDLNFLSVGKLFPPIEEAKRIGAYTEYDLLFDGNSHAVEAKHFRETLKNLNTLAMKMGWTESYLSIEMNYFRFISKKTMDFVCGEYPDITAGDGKNDLIDEIRRETAFDKKHNDAWLSVSRYGLCPLRIYRDGEHDTFTLVNPKNYYKIVSPEDPYKVTHYVITNLSYDERLKNVVLTAQIHEKGKFTVRTFLCKTVAGVLASQVNGLRYKTLPMDRADKTSLYTLICDNLTDEIFRYSPVEIIKELTVDPKPVETGLDDFAVLELSNIADSDGIYAVSDYEDVESVIAMMQRIMTEVQLIFDKFTVPTGYGDIEMASFDKTVGENFFEIGKWYGIPQGGVVPGYIQPEITRLEVYFRALERLESMLRTLSEMGGVVTAGNVPSGIAVETMKSLYTSELKKAERLTTRNTDTIVKIFSLLSKSRGKQIPETDIKITWYDGLPNSEQTDANISTTKLGGNLSSIREELRTRFNKSEEEIDKIIEERLQELSDFSAYNSMGGGFGGFGVGGAGNVPNGENGENAPKNGGDVNGEEE